MRAMHLLVGDAFFLGPFVDRQIEAEHALELFLQARRVPLLGIGVFRHVLGDQIVDHRVAHVGDGLGDMLVLHQLDALVEDDLALVVHHVVELEDVLADVEVARLDLLLRLLQRLVDPGMDDRLVLLQPELGAACRRACRSRRCASGRLRATGRTSSGPGRPGGRSGRAAGCRCAGSRGARCRARTARRPRARSPSAARPARGSRRRADRACARRNPRRRTVPAGCACRHCRRAECRCRGPPCWWRS